ncbi:MAG: sigma-70 family RNA polymerase sigma factor [Planctomycetota bacterium]
MSTQQAHPWPELLADLRRYVRRRVRDSHAAEDLVQETLTRLAAQLQHKPPAGPLHAWVLRVARNAIIDRHRTRKDAPAPVDELAAPDAVPQIERGGLLASFRRFIHALPAEQREAVLLTEYEGVTQRELAARLGVSVSTVKSRVQRGRKRLAKALTDCCTFEFDRRGTIVDWQRRPGGDCSDC